MDVIQSMIEQIKGKNFRIVYPEATDVRILGAAARHQKDGYLVPVLIGNPDEIAAKAKEFEIDLGDIEIIDPDNYDGFDEMVTSFVERRKGKVDEEKAREILKNTNYFGTMLTYMGLADGMVSGAVNSTGDTVRPALQIVKMAPGFSRVSGAFGMIKGDTRYVFADTAINITLDAQALAEVAVASAQTAKMFDIEPRVALLSFSTMGSAVSPESQKVAEATKIAKEMAPDLAIDGELQFDAALIESVGQKKAPNSPVAGKANVFIFPELQSGNIGYKIAERLGGFEALGPILQGLAKPINDLSRGCNEEDAYKLAVITAAQAAVAAE